MKQIRPESRLARRFLFQNLGTTVFRHSPGVPSNLCQNRWFDGTRARSRRKERDMPPKGLLSLKKHLFRRGIDGLLDRLHRRVLAQYLDGLLRRER